MLSDGICPGQAGQAPQQMAKDSSTGTVLELADGDVRATTGRHAPALDAEGKSSLTTAVLQNRGDKMSVEA
jgi:hypothetical protein